MSEIVVKVNDVKFGDKSEFGVIAGPCAVENKEQLTIAAKAVKDQGVKILRASAYKPRTSPKDFQGLGRVGIDILSEIGKEFKLATETEIMDPREVSYAADKIDILRVGARNMQNFDLLKEMNKVDNPIILKNGLASTYKEFISAANYLLENGKENVILCYRGIRSFETATRFTCDMLSYQKISELTKQPIIFDPSHPAGERELVLPISKTAVAADFDGLIVETHPAPDKALSDAAQQIACKDFSKFMKGIEVVASAVGKKVN